MAFTPATRENAKLRMAIMGPSKSGKTYTALEIATELAGPEGKIAFIDTENGSASKYSGPGGFKFDVDELKNHHPKTFIQAIVDAVKGGYSCLIIDSLSHEWMGKNGCLQLVDDAAKASRSGNSYIAWGDVTPLHNEVFDVINRAPIHIICTFRVKTETVMQTQEVNGKTKTVPVKIGLAPVTRDGAEYEFDILMDMDKGTGYIDHTSRCPYLQYMAVQYPGKDLARIIMAWLEGREPNVQLPGGPAKEEKMIKVASAPKSGAQAAEARPNVPTEAAAKGKAVPKPDKSQATSTPATQDAPAQKMSGGDAKTTGSDALRVAEDPKTNALTSTQIETSQVSTGSGQMESTQAQAGVSSQSLATTTTDPKSQSVGTGANIATETVAKEDAAQTAAMAASSDTQTKQSGAEQKITKTEFAQLLQAGTANGWKREDISAWVCKHFGYTAKTITSITWKQWEEAVRYVSDAKTAGGPKQLQTA